MQQMVTPPDVWIELNVEKIDRDNSDDGNAVDPARASADTGAAAEVHAQRCTLTSNFIQQIHKSHDFEAPRGDEDL